MFKKIVVGAVTAGLALTLAPTAQTEDVVTVQQLCSYDSPVMQPHFKPGKGLTCAPSASVFVPGIALRVIAAHWDGAYPVDPANQWSDWVLPGGLASWHPTG